MTHADITERTNMNEIAPCPFCGSKAVTTKTLADHLEWHSVECCQCTCEMTAMTEVEAIAYWNTRQPVRGIDSAARNAVIEECAALVEKLWMDGEPYSEVFDHVRALARAVT